MVSEMLNKFEKAFLAVTMEWLFFLLFLNTRHLLAVPPNLVHMDLSA